MLVLELAIELKCAGQETCLAGCGEQQFGRQSMGVNREAEKDLARDLRARFARTDYILFRIVFLGLLLQWCLRIRGWLAAP